MDAYGDSKTFSQERLNTLRSKLSGITNDSIIVTCGSYARREARKESDIDFFIIEPHASAGSNEELLSNAGKIIGSVGPIEPSPSGAFAQIEHEEGMLVNIGGDNDTNQKLTRRMLFLLEGDWLANETGFNDIRRKILERYVSSVVSDHALSLFLLNDVIRYYRTMTVDYEFKTSEGENPKPWGIRNIKLVFSRKLLYASGLFSVAMTANLTRDKKIEELERLLKLPVLDRMIDICGKAKMENVSRSYDRFLEKMADPNTRNHLKSLGNNERDDLLFRDLKNESHRFTRELLKLFEGTFDTTHPIRRAVMF